MSSSATSAASAVVLSDDLYQVAILIDELKHAELQCRLNSLRRLGTIAAALGPERTRNELVPYVGEGVEDDDEVLLVMADQLRGLVDAVGGPAFAHVLLAPLEALASVEESSVRDRAVAAINAVMDVLPITSVVEHAWPLVARLGEREWVTARATACGLCARIYARLPPRKGGAGEGKTEGATAGGAGGKLACRDDALALYKRLCSSEEVAVVRRAAAAEFGAMATALAAGTLPPPPPPGGSAASAAASAPRPAGSVIDPASTVQVDTGHPDHSVSGPPAVPTPVIVSAASAAAGGSAAATLLPLAQAFSRDEQDSVRLLAVISAAALARLANGGTASVCDGSEAARARLAINGDVRRAALVIVSALVSDRAWRVRWSVAHRITELAEAVGVQGATSDLLPALEQLLSDAEPEVRSAAAFRVAEMGKLVGREAVQRSLLPTLNRFTEDASEHVRASLACVLLGLAPVLGKDATIEGLLPLFLRLLKDPSPQVRLNIIAKLEAVNSVVGLKQLSQSLLPAIQELSGDKSWRVRQATIDFLPRLGAQLGADGFFDTSSRLTDLAIQWLSDPVFSIRESATLNLKHLASTFGASWAERVLIPRMLALVDAAAAAGGSLGAAALGTSSPFQMRMTALLALVTLGEALPPTLFCTRLLPAALAFSRDPIPNIRFNVAKALARLAKAGKIEAPVMAASVRPALALLASDADVDVRSEAAAAQIACR